MKPPPGVKLRDGIEVMICTNFFSVWECSHTGEKLAMTDWLVASRDGKLIVFRREGDVGPPWMG